MHKDDLKKGRAILKSIGMDLPAMISREADRIAYEMVKETVTNILRDFLPGELERVGIQQAVEKVAVAQAAQYISELGEDGGNIRWSVNHAIGKAIDVMAEQQAEMIAKQVTVSINLQVKE